MLVVIPLILVFLVAEIVVGYLIRSASIETIDAVQENIATVLSNDVRTNALQLSHFVYVNDGEFVQVAAPGAWQHRKRMVRGGSGAAEGIPNGHGTLAEDHFRLLLHEKQRCCLHEG